MLFRFHGKTSSALLGSLGAAAVALSLSGCSMGTMQMSGAAPSPDGITISGHVHGGDQGVTGSTIQLYTVGTSGYGSAGTALIGTTVLTDQNSYFSITGKFTCPVTPALVYITATAGNPGLAAGTNNTAIKLAAGLGLCTSLNPNTFIDINETSTVATAFALGQYFTTTYGTASSDSFGAPGGTQAQTGMTNAFATINNLASIATGTAVVTNTLTGAGTLGSITATPDANKVNTIADIIAACVNSDGSATSDCQTTLFPDVTPTGGTPPTDTLQAAVLMSLYPTSNNAAGSAANITALFNSISTTPPFPAAATAPTDWTIGINFSAGTATNNTLMNGVQDIAADSNGNIWLINLSTVTAESLAEFSPTGTPLANPFNSGAAAPASFASTSPRNLALDTNNNVFVTTSSGSGYMFEYSATGAATSLNVGGQPYGITIDGANNIFVGQNSSSSASSLTEFTNGTLAATNQIKYPLLTGTTNTLLQQYVAVSTDGSIWGAGGSGANASYRTSGLNPGSCTTFPCTPVNDTSLTATYTPIAAGNLSSPYGVTAGPGGIMYFANSANNTLAAFTSATASTTIGSASSLSGPRKIAIDGNGNLWVANRASGAISEFTPTGTVLSPTPVSPATTPIGFAHAGIASGSSITIDPSGNVWIGNNTAPAATADADSIFELVGAAAPTVTPLAAQLPSKIGTKPQ